MKSVRLPAFTAFCLFMCLHMPVFAQDDFSVAGNKYNVVIFCTGGAGGYCDQNEIKYDEFDFGSDDDFDIESFEDELLGIGGEGEYYENGMSFNAGYKVIDDDLDKYEFGMGGISFSENNIVGIMEIKYYEWDIFDYEKKDEATAYFVGMNN